MNFAQSVLEIVSLIIGLATLGLVLSRSGEASELVSTSGRTLEGLISAASMNASAPISTSFRRR